MASNERSTVGRTHDLAHPGGHIFDMHKQITKHVIPEEEFSTGVDDRPYQTSIFTKMGKLFQQEELSDVMLMAEGQSIPCHKMLLASVSEYFHRRFVTDVSATGNNLLEIDGITFQTLKLIVSYLYSGKIKINVGNIKELIAASEMLKLTSLTETCGNYAVNTLDTTNCLGFYRVATEYNVKGLGKMVHEVMVKKFMDVVMGSEFRKLTEDEVIKYIRDEKLRILNEDPVYDAVVAWVQYDIETRRGCFPNLLKHVRLAYCSPSHLQNVVAREPLMEHPECQKKLTLSFVHQLSGEDRTNYMQGSDELNVKPRVYYNTILLIGQGHWSDSVECYLLTDREWMHMNDLLSPQLAKVKEFSVCLTKDGVLVSGGFREKALSECWLLSTTKSEWTTMPNLNTARYGHVSVAVGDQVFVVGGRGGNKPTGCKGLLSSLERMDTACTDGTKWAPAPALAMPLKEPMIVCLDHYMYVFGQATVKVVEEVPIETSRMFRSAPYQHIGHCYGDEQYIKRGIESTKSKSFGFDAVSMKWSELADMPKPCSQGSAVAFLKKIYVVGGAERWCMCLDPYLGQWTMMSKCEYQHISAPAVVWKGRILVCGGQMHTTQGAMKEMSEVEEYDPRINTWRGSNLKLPDAARPQFIFAIENGTNV